MVSSLAMQGDAGLIPGMGAKIPCAWSNLAHAWQLLSPHAITRESVHHDERSHVAHQRWKISSAATKT